MRRISQVIAGFAIAGAATFGGLSMAGPAAASGDGALVDVTVENVLNGNEVTVLNDVTVPVAAVFCGLDVNVLTGALGTAEKTECTALSVPGTKTGWVKK